MGHEIEHALGADDFHDPVTGDEIDSTGPSGMGAYIGNNNSGGGHLTQTTSCDKTIILLSQTYVVAGGDSGEPLPELRFGNVDGNAFGILQSPFTKTVMTIVSWDKLV